MSEIHETGLAPAVYKEAAVDASVEKPESLPDLLSFYLGLGKRRAPYREVHTLLPALLSPYRDLSAVRYDYPLCISEKAEEVVTPVTNIFNRLLGEIGGQTDSERRLQLYLQKLEVAVKSLAESISKDGAIKKLSALWAEGKAQICDRLDANDPADVQIEKDLDALRQSLPEGDVVVCDGETAIHVMYALWKETINRKYGLIHNTLTEMVFRLESILAADAAKSEEAYSPESLQTLIGTRDELDFSELSKILSPRVGKERLSPERRKHIENAIRDSKELMRGVLPKEKRAEPGKALWIPGALKSIDASLAKALPEVREQMGKILRQIQAVFLAELETEDAYKPELHDAFFADFDWRRLPEETLSLCPPIVIILTGLKEADASALFEILTWKMPIKLVVLADVSREGWLKNIGEMAITLEDVFVAQSAVNNLPAILPTIREGLAYNGPALFSIYTGSSRTLSPYLASAAALESRAWVSFTYHPGRGSTWAERFTIAETPQHDQDWPISPFTYQAVDGQEMSLSIPFTCADFWATEERMSSHFLCVPKNAYHANMVMLHEYLSLIPDQARDKVPYILMVDEQNTVHRVVVDQVVMTRARKMRDAWRRLQELGGINNSHALKLVAEEKRRLEEEKNHQVAAIEQKYKEQMDQNVGELAEAMIDKIAAGLLGVGAATLPSAPPAPKAAAPAQPAQATAAPAAPVEEAVEIVIEDPGIDTPRCTTCNECTNLNKRMFAYNENKQAYIKDIKAGTYAQLVQAAEKCPARIIHPGKPLNPNEEGLAALIERAKPFNKV